MHAPSAPDRQTGGGRNALIDDEADATDDYCSLSDTGSDLVGFLDDSTVCVLWQRIISRKSWRLFCLLWAIKISIDEEHLPHFDLDVLSHSTAVSITDLDDINKAVEICQ